jgi:L-threonylcarbamoyladenylate synthase
MQDQIHKAFEVLQNGGIILYPTDTVWAIGCDATNETAVEKINILKKNTAKHGMICLLNGDKMIYNIFKDVPEVAWQILDLSEKPTSLVLDKPRNIAPILIAADNSIGIRIVKEPFCYKLLERFKKPIVATTANVWSEKFPRNFQEITAEIKNGVDYIVDFNKELHCENMSTIIKLTLDNQVKIIRK